VLFVHTFNLFLQYEIMLKMSVPPLFRLYFPTHSFTRVPTLWKTATIAAVVVREDQKAYWSGKCNPFVNILPNDVSLQRAWNDWGDRYRYKVTWLTGLLSSATDWLNSSASGDAKTDATIDA